MFRLGRDSWLPGHRNFLNISYAFFILSKERYFSNSCKISLWIKYLLVMTIGSIFLFLLLFFFFSLLLFFALLLSFYWGLGSLWNRRECSSAIRCYDFYFDFFWRCSLIINRSNPSFVIFNSSNISWHRGGLRFISILDFWSAVRNIQKLPIKGRFVRITKQIYTFSIVQTLSFYWT